MQRYRSNCVILRGWKGGRGGRIGPWVISSIKGPDMWNDRKFTPALNINRKIIPIMWYNDHLRNFIVYIFKHNLGIILPLAKKLSKGAGRLCYISAWQKRSIVRKVYRPLLVWLTCKLLFQYPMPSWRNIRISSGKNCLYIYNYIWKNELILFNEFNKFLTCHAGDPKQD